MKKRYGNRIVGILLSVMMVVGVFASSVALHVDAALTDAQKNSEYQITINDVTRKYPMAKQLLDGINSKRSSLGLSTVRMDS